MYAVEDISFKELSRKVNATSYSIKSLENKGLVKLYHREVSRNPIKRNQRDKKHILSSSQRKVYQRIKNSFHGNDNSNKFLIHGVTGSGKTEIYLQLVEEMIELGKDSIILVPEISLTPQTIDRFVGRFGI